MDTRRLANYLAIVTAFLIMPGISVACLIVLPNQFSSVFNSLCILLGVAIPAAFTAYAYKTRKRDYAQSHTEKII